MGRKAGAAAPSNGASLLMLLSRTRCLYTSCALRLVGRLQLRNATTARNSSVLDPELDAP